MMRGLFDLPTFTFFDEKNIWTGSLYTDFNYKIFPIKIDELKELKAVIWFGMLSFDNISEEDYHKVLHTELSDDGYQEMIKLLNDEAENFKATHTLRPKKY